MAGLKSLAKDTAIYGLSSIVGRFLNYLLVPIYAAAMSAASGGYGVVTEVYAWTALLMVILTYGMETTFFRFVNKETENSERVYSTVLFMVGSTSLIFAALCMLFLHPVAGMMGYGDHPWYIGMMALVIAMDAFQCIPFAYLRYKKRPIRFAALKLLFILLNITLNLVYYVVMKGSDVFYAFFFNLICTSVIMVLMVPYLKFNGGFDKPLAKRMLIYSYPILILGVAGILNQVADKIIFRHIYPDKVEAKTQLAIYGACSKIAMIMAMLTQAFRYAYEPFVFGKSRDKDSKIIYAQAMKSTQQEISTLKKQLSETTGFFKGKVRKSLEGKIEQAEKQEKRIHTDMEQTVKQAGYPDVQSFTKTYQKSEKLVREYNEELRAWNNQTEPKKEQSSEPSKKASIREKLHHYQQESRQQPKQSVKKKSMDRER